MHKGKSFLAIIPARGGSKGLPKKNIRPLCGKPLIAWTIEAALASQYIDEVMVTTDSEEIMSVAKQFGASAPFLRPAELASDTSTTFDSVKHTIDFYSSELGKQFDYIVLLEPTSPLREKSDLGTMIDRIVSMDEHFDSIVSMGEVREHPSIMKKRVGDTIEPYCKDLPMTMRRQDNDEAYFPYGVAYIAKTSALLEERTFYTHRITYHIIKRFQCYEIDDIYDFLAIESIMKNEWGIQ